MAPATGGLLSDSTSVVGSGKNSTVAPADYVTITTSYRNNIVFEDETPVLWPSGGPRVLSEYRVRDYEGTVVASGSAYGSPIVLPRLAPGTYKVYLLRSGTEDATYGRAQGMCQLSVWRRTTGFPDRGARSADRGATAGNDVALHGLTLLGPIRHSISNATTAPELANVTADAAALATWYTAYDTARTKAQLCAFPNGTIGEAAGVQTVVNALKSRVTWWETRNEPDTSVSAADYITELTEFRTAVLTADPTAKILGPGVVTLNGTRRTWLTDFFAAGGGALIDGFSFHDYNTGGSDIQLARRCYDEIETLLTTYGQQAKPRWMTEWGTFAAMDGVNVSRVQARQTMIATLMHDQFGVPKERTFWFYDRSHGFWTFSSFLQNEVDDLYPVATMLRVFAEEVLGKTYAAELDFGTVENDVYIGNRYTSVAGDSLAIVSAGRTDGSVTLAVTGASSLTVVDHFGNTSTVVVSGGSATVAVGNEPVYVRVPSGVTATVTPRTYGTNIALTATATASAGSRVSRVNDGLFETSYYYDSDSVLSTEFPHYNATLPAWVQLDWGGAQTFNTVIVHCPNPWQFQTSLLDFDLQYWNGSTWVTIQTVTKSPVSVASMTKDSEGGTRVDSFYDEQHIFQFEFSAISTSKLRIYARSTSYGHLPDAKCSGAAPVAGGQAMSIREIQVFDRP